MKRWWQNSPLRIKGIVVVGIPVVLLLAQSVLFLFVLQADHNASKAVGTARRVKNQLQNVLTLVLDAETAQRGYLINRSPSFLEPNQLAFVNLPPALEGLTILTSPDKVQSSQVMVLRKLIAHRPSLSSALSLPTSELKGWLVNQKKSTDSIRAQIATMSTLQDSIVSTAEATQTDLENISTAIILAALGTGVLAGAIGATLIAKSVTNRILLLEELADHLHSEEPLAEPDSSEDEIGRLSRRLFAVAGLMRERQSALLEARLFLELIISAATVVATRWTASGEISYVSPNCERVLGLMAEDLLGPNALSRWVSQEGSNEIRVAVNNLIEGKVKEADIELELLTDRDHTVQLRITRAVVDEKVELVGYFADITAYRDYEKQLADREARFAAVIEASPDGIYVVDSEFRSTWLSSALSSLLGSSLIDAIGSSTVEAFHLEDQDGFRRAMENVRDGMSDMEVVRIRRDHTDGMELIFEARVRRVAAWGDAQSLLIVVRDVTQEVQILSELKDAQELADSANLAKSEFLSRMSHELRTPLNAILGFTQLLEMDELSESQHEAVRQIGRGGKHLLELINEVLDIARIEAGKLSLSSEPVLIHELIIEALEMVQPIADVYGITISAPTGDLCYQWISGDRQRVKQVLLNLLSNGIKYNRSGGEVRVSCQGQPDDMLAVSVSDTGIGLPESYMHNLFVPFNRMGAEASDIEGTGVGLALSMGLMKAMGGRIEAKSTKGVGSTFTIFLPTTQPPEASSTPLRPSLEPTTTSNSRNSATTVVYIEDNWSNLALVEQVAAHQGNVHLRHASHGLIGLELIMEELPDLVLLDLHLPDISGTEVLIKLRADDATRDIPVAVLSADATPRQIRRLLEMGADRYLTKPLDVSELLSILEDPNSLVLARRSLEDQREH